ncbi:MAG: glycerate kinase [Opitutales bacterium]
MHALVAFDKFKDALTAREACRLAAEAFQDAAPGAKVTEAPLTDGGEGFAEILTSAAGGTLESVEVSDPRFRPVTAQLGWIALEALPAAARELLDLPAKGRLAIVEMAQASGLQLLSADERDPWETSTYGTGQLIGHAAAAGATAILLGIGGSATNDLGLGALEALGLQAYQADLQPVPQITPGKWSQITSLGGLVNAATRLPPLRIACDVDNPLLGPQGATAAYGPQKGLQPSDFDRLERGMRKQAARLLGLFSHPLAEHAERLAEPGSGAAGGIGFGLRNSLADARYVPGFALVEAWLQLPAKIAAADLVFTGEGRFDATSLQGKGPASVLARALEGGQAAHLLAGAITPQGRAGLPPQAHAEALSPEDLPLAAALSETGARLSAAVRRVAVDLS